MRNKLCDGGVVVVNHGGNANPKYSYRHEKEITHSQWQLYRPTETTYFLTAKLCIRVMMCISCISYFRVHWKRMIENDIFRFCHFDPDKFRYNDLWHCVQYRQLYGSVHKTIINQNRPVSKTPVTNKIIQQIRYMLIRTLSLYNNTNPLTILLMLSFWPR